VRRKLIRNKRGDEDVLNESILTMMMIPLAIIMMFTYMMIVTFGGAKAAESTQIIEEIGVTSSNPLLLLAEMRDEHNTPYFELLERSVKNPNENYHGDDIAGYTSGLVEDLLSTKYEYYYFYVKNPEGDKVTNLTIRGDAPSGHTVYTKSLVLPTTKRDPNTNEIKMQRFSVNLEVWEVSTT